MSAVAAVEPLVGNQSPRILVRPDGAVSSAAAEVVGLCEAAGLVLDPWQRTCLDVILAEGADGGPAASIAGLIVPRQNGKGEVLIALELGWLFLWGIPLISHSAHLFSTSQEAFARVLHYVDNADFLRKRVKRVSSAHGKEGITLLSGSRLKFMARTGGGGRGFTADRQVMDEAYDLPDAHLEAMMPTLSARPNTQLVFTSSAGMAESVTLRRIRQRALDGDSERFAYLEWSVDHAGFDPDDEAAWAFANPAYGYRISRRAVADERAMMSESGFARERLGVWDQAVAASAFDVEAFAACTDPGAAPDGRIVFGVDAAPGGTSAAVVAGDGTAVEVVAHRAGMDWLSAEVLRLAREHRAAVVVDPAGPVGGLVPQWQAQPGVDVVTVTTRDMTAACGGFAQALAERSLRIRPHDGLSAGMAAARRRPVGDAWALRRAGGDICPVVAATLAHWQATRAPVIDLASQIF